MSKLSWHLIPNTPHYEGRLDGRVVANATYLRTERGYGKYAVRRAGENAIYSIGGLPTCIQGAQS